MSRKLFVLLTIGSAVTLSSAALAQRPTAQADVSPARIIGEYICVFDGSVARGNVRAEANRIIAREGGQALHHYTHAIRGFAARIPDQSVERMIARNPNIAYCEQNQVMRAVYQRAAGKPGGGGATQPPQSTPWGVTRVHGGGANNAGRVAWVIDTGIDLDHPDLNVDVARSVSFVRDISPNDQNGHGTHVAGTIGAINNTIGVIGVAPGATVIAVRVLDRNGRGTTSGVIDGVDHVAEHGSPGEVANMSLGGGVSTALDTAVVNAAATGVRFTLAAGNESDNANNHSPARANGDNVYTVSAFRNGDLWASFSNFGNPPIDYAEPGVSVLSTYKDGGYASLSGTSMAAPHLAGLLLLGNVRGEGTVSGDPDPNDDTIGVH